MTLVNSSYQCNKSVILRREILAVKSLSRKKKTKKKNPHTKLSTYTDTLFKLTNIVVSNCGPIRDLHMLSCLEQLFSVPKLFVISRHTRFFILNGVSLLQ